MIFELDVQFSKDRGASINIIGREPKDKVYVSISGADEINIGYIKDKDLERFARNILRALGKK